VFVKVLLLVVRLWASFICLAPPSFVGTVTYEKKLLYFHIVDLYIRIYLYNFYLHYCIVLYILLRYITLFADTSTNILLIIGIIFSVFLGPDKHLQFWMSVAVCQWQAKIVCLHNIKAVTYFWQQISHQTETGFNQIRCGKSNNIQLCFVFCGGCRGEGNLWLNFEFEIFYSGSGVSVSHSKVTTNLRCVTFQKSDDLIGTHLPNYTESEARRM
jgi:hypothetical protein